MSYKKALKKSDILNSDILQFTNGDYPLNTDLLKGFLKWDPHFRLKKKRTFDLGTRE